MTKSTKRNLDQPLKIRASVVTTAHEARNGRFAELFFLALGFLAQTPGLWAHYAPSKG